MNLSMKDTNKKLDSKKPNESQVVKRNDHMLCKKSTKEMLVYLSIHRQSDTKKIDTTKKEKSNRKKSYCSSKNHIGFDQDNLFSLYIHKGANRYQKVVGQNEAGRGISGLFLQ